MKTISLINTQKFPDNGINQNCWVALSLTSFDEPVILYTSKESGLDEFSDFKEFSEYHINEMIKPKTQLLKETNDDSSFEMRRVYSEITDDVDINNRVIDVASTQAQIIKTFNGGVSTENINTIIKDLTGVLFDIENSESELTLDSHQRQTNPHKYYGIDKKSF